MGELFKLPVLAAHYVEHRLENPAIDFTDFLLMHYGGDDQNDQDQDRDEQLPFKKITESNSLQVVFLPESFPMESLPGFSPKNSTLQVAQSENLSDPSLDCLFRPPRS